jgi:hypothetical protein
MVEVSNIGALPGTVPGVGRFFAAFVMVNPSFTPQSA